VAGRIVDIGCGRGEMLSILEQAGHEVMGVDPDPDMIAACKSRGLPAVVDDGIGFLSLADDDSLKGIFCSQVVEHLITPELEQLILLAHEKLQRGGVLVIETINPRSSYALGNHFYADTSHVRPVHPETLRYICEQVGFVSVELEERSPHPFLGLTDDLPDGAVGEAVAALLENVFGHQDYVIVASK
jgi:SAM-dependent methyltransferase